jgi:hypothetical protein
VGAGAAVGVDMTVVVGPGVAVGGADTTVVVGPSFSATSGRADAIGGGAGIGWPLVDRTAVVSREPVMGLAVVRMGGGGAGGTRGTAGGVIGGRCDSSVIS